MHTFALLDLSVQDVFAGIPHDAGAVVVYLVLATFVGLIWLGSRRRSPH